MSSWVWIPLQIFILCASFFLMLKAVVRNDGRNMLYFYPKDYQKKAVELGLTEEKKLRRQWWDFMVPFTLVLVLEILCFLVFWNRVKEFWTAYFQSLVLLEAMDLFDFLLDRLWISKSKIWVIPEMEGFPYQNSWQESLLKRGAGLVLLALLAFANAGIVYWLGTLF